MTSGDNLTYESISKNRKISVNYAYLNEIWCHNETSSMVYVLMYFLARSFLGMILNHAPLINANGEQIGQNGKRQSSQTQFLIEKKGLGPIVSAPSGIVPLGYKYVLVRKRNEKNEILSYKARLMVQ